MSSYEEALAEVQKQTYRIRCHTDLMGVGPISDMIKRYSPILPGMVPKGQAATMATDGTTIYIGPEFVMSLKASELRFILLHEWYHVGFKHFLRVADDRLNPGRVNRAQDLVINPILRNTEAFRTGFITWPEGGLYEPRFDGREWTWERIYHVLSKEEPEDNDDDEGGRGPGAEQGDGEAGGSANGQGEGDGEADDQGGNGQGAAGDQNGGRSSDAGDSDKAGEDGTKSVPPEPDATGNGGAGQGQKLRGSGEWGAVWAPTEPLSPEQAAEIEQEIDCKLAEGEFAEKCWGVGSGKQSSLGKIKESENRTSCWDLMRDLLEPQFSCGRTWSRPNVLFQETGYFPARTKEGGVLHAVFDMSGSMSKGEIKLSYDNLVGICDQIGVSTLRVAYVDWDILRPHGETWHEFDLTNGEEIEIDVVGRGGTRFDPIFDEIDDELEEVQALVYFTDGEGYILKEEPDFPVIWATTNIPPMTRDNDLWGEVVEIAADLAREEVFYR